MTIYEIKKQTKKTAPYFFNRETLKFFGQTKIKTGEYKLINLN